MLRLLALVFSSVLIVFLLSRLDVTATVQPLLHIGWAGFAAVIAGGLLLTLGLASGFYPLLQGEVGALGTILSRQLRDSVGDILPFTQFGGIAAGMRMLTLMGQPPIRAIAAGTVDMTTELFAQSLFMLLGLTLAAPAIRASAWAPYLPWLMVATLLFAGGILVFVLLQWSGSRFADAILARLNRAEGETHVQAAVHGLYRRRRRIAASVLLHLVGWLASGAWLWLLLWVLGAPLPLLSAIAIQSLLEALRSATVFIPAAIGVQEAGYATLMPLFGLPPETGLAVSLLRRARDLTVGIPMLLLWQAIEGRAALRRLR